jgi:hypothetical protein
VSLLSPFIRRLQAEQAAFERALAAMPDLPPLGRPFAYDPDLVVGPACGCGSRAVYGEGGPHAHYCDLYDAGAQ